MDVLIPGLGGGLSLVRTWNSLWPSSYAALNVGIFGPNWRSNYEQRMLVNNDDHYIRYSRGDGSYWSFAFSGRNPDDTWSYYVVAPANVKATLKTGSNWTITFQNGEQRVFDRPDGPLVGKLLSIIDRNGNTTQLTYDAGARLVAVTDTAGRHLSFTYGTGDLSNLVTAVTSDPAAGISLTYTYDPALLRLTRVTLPDNTFVTFEYEAHGLISAVKDVAGKVLEAHTYDDKSRGLSSSRAGGVDAITVAYPQ
jgi:YD repeat-containing protein